jgi:hypothetical protein
LFVHSPPSTGKDSIFGSGTGTWDRILDVDELMRSRSKPNNRPTGTSARQGITPRETQVLTGMLDMIFDSNNGKGPGISEEEKKQVVLKQNNDFLDRLRRHSKHGNRMGEPDAILLDRKKEQISLCNSDQELLDWAIQEVFEESKKYEAVARQAIEKAAKAPGSTEAPPLQPPTYPYMISTLMRTFRDKYRDPHLALSIFNYTKSLSIVSYVFGCSTDAYNELVQTKWECFSDLPGVYQSINEMVINGVPLNSRTRELVETVRRDLLSEKERLDLNEAGQVETWQLLKDIDQVIATGDNGTQRRSKARWDRWKSEVMKDDKTEAYDWGFDSLTRNKQYSRRGTTRGEDALLPTFKY